LAQDAKDDLAASGQEFAIKVCGNCHMVEKGQTPILKKSAPSFDSIVRSREIDEAWLRRFLATPHGKLGSARKMPNPQLADFEIDKIIAYFGRRKVRKAP